MKILVGLLAQDAECRDILNAIALFGQTDTDAFHTRDCGEHRLDDIDRDGDGRFYQTTGQGAKVFPVDDRAVVAVVVCSKFVYIFPVTKTVQRRGGLIVRKKIAQEAALDGAGPPASPISYTSRWSGDPALI